jgi:REP element-mobilizing transposase RayT
MFSITICTARRRPIFAEKRCADAVFASVFEGVLSREAECLAVCLMSDHLHLLLMPKKANLVSLLNRWKAFTTNLLHRMGLQGQVWQRSFYDHALRGPETEFEVAEYIVSNPVRRGLVARWKSYPYAWMKWDSS